MKITLDQDVLAKAVTSHLRGVGVQSDIVAVIFRYTRVPYAVFAEVELAEAKAPKPSKNVVREPETKQVIVDDPPPPVVTVPLLDPATLPDEPPADDASSPVQDLPTAPLFGGG